MTDGKTVVKGNPNGNQPGMSTLSGLMPSTMSMSPGTKGASLGKTGGTNGGTGERQTPPVATTMKPGGVDSIAQSPATPQQR